MGFTEERNYLVAVRNFTEEGRIPNKFGSAID